MKTLLVVDDHPIVIEGIQSVLSHHGYKVVKATTPQQALSLAENLPQIDIFVIDLSLNEGTDGLDLIREIREAGIEKPSIVYTMHEELWNIATLMKADVDGIVLKGDNVNELLLAVEEVADGHRYISRSFEKRRSEVLNTKGILSEKDIEVIRRIAAGESTKDISRAMFLSEKAVEYHRGNILRKLCAKTISEATTRAIRLGIVTSILLCAAVPSHLRASVPVEVDLGLSVNWADRNLGAESPDSAGGFYAFGEAFTKEKYDWSTYTHCDGDILEQHYFGTDCIAGTEFDAAATVLGDGWRLPTIAECEELIAASLVSIEPAGGTSYATLVFNAANGNSIRFPIVGYMSLGRVVYENMEGHCWTAELYNESGEEDGFSYSMNTPFYFSLCSREGQSPTIWEGSPHLGFQVRPVRDKSSEVSDITLSSDSPVESIHNIQGLYVGKDAAALPQGVYIMRFADGRVIKTVIRR